MLAQSSFNQNQLKEIAHSLYWLRLGHYKKDIFSGYTSQIDSKLFFFSSDGKHDPLEELKASLKAFDMRIGEVPLKDHPQCRFPERYRYLKKKLNLQTTNIHCSEYRSWIDSLSPHSATLIYAGSYPTNPASIFGHTFLRITSNKSSRLQKGSESNKRVDFLDYALSYAANANASMGLIYAFKGIFGGYQGLYTLEPYYMKVNEYNLGESRDLWEFKLDINQEQTARMISHMWELYQNSYFDYFFFDENCSYHILTLLEVARTDWDLSDQIHLYVSPIESVKILDRVGAIKKVKHRPSLYKEMIKKVDSLSPNQKNQFNQIVKYEIAPIADSAILEAVSTYLFYQKQEQYNKLDKKQSKLYRQTLITRSQIKNKNISTPDTGDYKREISPLASHSSMQIGLSSGLEEGDRFQQLKFRLAVHDQLNKGVGFARFSKIEVFKGQARYYDEQEGSDRYSLERLDFFRLTSLLPMTSFEKNISWQASLSYYKPKDLSNFNSNAFLFDGSIGNTITPFSEANAIYYLVGAKIEEHHRFKNKFRFGPTITLGTIWNNSKSYNASFHLKLYSDLLQDDRQKYYLEYQLGQAYLLTTDLDIRCYFKYIQRTKKNSNNFQEQMITFNYHFE